jgi:hypothetical protein
MAGGSIDLAQFRLDILSSGEIAVMAEVEAQKVLNEQKETLIREFNEHPVTKEIESGPDAANSSGTLGGKGNLFSFIGFDDTDTPTQPVKKLLSEIELGSLKRNSGKNVFEFNVKIPSNEEFESATKMPWESGRSWLFDVERAISGLGNYLYGKFKNSRSGTGVETSESITSKTFMPVSYFATMLDKFIQNLKQ